VEVADLRRRGEHFVSVTFAGPLAGFAELTPAQHIKVLIPEPGAHEVRLPEAGPDGPVWPADQPRPVVRTYTPRSYDAAAGTLEVQFLLHGEGPASAWAERAAVGDKLGIAGPGGRPVPVEAGVRWIIAGDESAIPAIATLLDVLPASAVEAVYVEGAKDASDEFELRSWPPVSWLPADERDPGAALHGLLTDGALAGSAIPADCRVWVACESVAVRRIRLALLGEGQLDGGRLITRGYWKAGEANHPDHDYGQD
jgi:NADPH-dependent ferric siderophore reductase